MENELKIWLECNGTSFGELNNERLFIESEVLRLLMKLAAELKE